MTVPAKNSQQAALSAHEVEELHAFWRACNYLALGMIYL